MANPDDVVVEFGHPGEEGTETAVVERLLLVLLRQFLAEPKGALVHLPAIKVIDAVRIKSLLQLPVSGRVRMSEISINHVVCQSSILRNPQ